MDVKWLENDSVIVWEQGRNVKGIAKGASVAAPRASLGDAAVEWLRNDSVIFWEQGRGQ